MASLGSLGKAKPRIDLDFDWFGHTIRVAEHASDLVELDFLAKAGSIDLDGVDLDATAVDPKALAAVSGAAKMAMDAAVGSVRRLIHPDDWDTFWQAAIDNGQSMTDLMAVQKTISEAIAGFPTGQPGDSTPGPTSTGTESGGGLSSPDSVADQAMAYLQGRPDLQAMVQRRQEELASRPS